MVLNVLRVLDRSVSSPEVGGFNWRETDWSMTMRGRDKSALHQGMARKKAIWAAAARAFSWGRLAVVRFAGGGGMNWAGEGVDG